MWDLATAKVDLGIAPADTTKDMAIQRTMNYVLATVETALQRKLTLARETVTFHPVTTRQLLLPRYPVLEVHSINHDTDHKIFINHRLGFIELCCGNVCGGCIKVDYTGGYDPLPSDLEWVLWAAFKHAWDQVDPNTGAPGAAAGVSGAQEVSSVSIFDFGTVKFTTNDGGSSSGSELKAQAALEARWGWLVPWASILTLYRAGTPDFA